jgi:hypothetical protein
MKQVSRLSVTAIAQLHPVAILVNGSAVLVPLQRYGRPTLKS